MSLNPRRHADIALDAKARGRAVHREVLDQYMAHATVGLAADGHAVAAVEMIVDDRRRTRSARCLLALIATLSSPVRMKLRVMVTLRDDTGSMPSVLRASAGVSRPAPQAVETVDIVQHDMKVMCELRKRDCDRA